MSQKATKKDIQKAAQHVAEDVLSDEQIAAKLGVNRRTLARMKKRPEFAAMVAKVKAARLGGATQAAEAKAFDTVTRLIELANLSHKDTRGTIQGQVRACVSIAEIRGEVVKLHGDVTDRLRNKTPEELDFIAIHRRDPKDAEELQQFVEARKQKVQ